MSPAEGAQAEATLKAINDIAYLMRQLVTLLFVHLTSPSSTQQAMVIDNPTHQTVVTATLNCLLKVQVVLAGVSIQLQVVSKSPLKGVLESGPKEVIPSQC